MSGAGTARQLGITKTTVQLAARPQLLRQTFKISVVKRSRNFYSIMQMMNLVSSDRVIDNGEEKNFASTIQNIEIPDLQHFYSDFQGRQLVVTTLNHWPFFQMKALENGTVLPISGIDFSLLVTLSGKLNFTYQLVTPPKGKWGGPQPDNTITGMVGQVARHEAHAALCSLTMTAIREVIVDFTMPYYLETGTLMSPAPKERNRAFAILSPFTLGVWLCICLATLLVGPLLYMVTRLLVVYLDEEDSPHYSLQSFSFNMYRNLMVQGNLIATERLSLRCILISWYLFSFYLYALYSGTLTAAFAITAYEKPIDSIHELAQAYRDGFTIGTYKDSNYVEAFKLGEMMAGTIGL
ncbi:glutamate receptor ionotropic, delta-2-like [Panulirus ornatus]|uniref:glutamate receptor ionotropic, delta-2-like n=1 Tax=Panulirus ornatus TaxID=150431 RepID=UPI003A841220